ncbi:MAG: methyltransferase domain-containing protein, partial [Caldilineaceae bacterium]|nr:methyltransferase domain-containing protein [Caldilineaceae bacterium]
MERFVAKVATQRRHESRSKQQIIGHHNALLLGVTPAIATMKWPRRSRLLAVDSSEGMLDAIWPGDEPGVRLARAGNWLTLPVKSGSCTTVIGDCSFNCVAFPTVVQQLAASVARVLKEDGVLILRLYVQPERAHSLEQYFDDLLNG